MCSFLLYLRGDIFSSAFSFFSFVSLFAFPLSQVEYIINPPLLQRYHSFKQELQRSGQPVAERLTFHGTTAAAIERIVVEGFRIGGVDTPVLAGTALGTGIYSSESPEFAMQCQKAAHCTAGCRTGPTRVWQR